MKKLVIAGLLITTLLLILLSGCKPVGKAIALPNVTATNIANFPYQFLTSTATTIGYSSTTIFAPAAYSTQVTDLMNFMRLKACQFAASQGYNCIDQQGNLIPTTAAVLGMRGITGASVGGQADEIKIYSCRRGPFSHIEYDHYIGKERCEYTTQRVLGRVLAAQPATGNTVQLTLCRKTDAPMDNDQVVGENGCGTHEDFVDTIGYAYTTQPTDIATSAITVCKFSSNGEQYVVDGVNCLPNSDAPLKTYWVLPFCNETDAGRDLNVKGSAYSFIDKTTYSDSCSGNNIVESYCDAQTPPFGVKRETIPCPQGFICSAADAVCTLDPNFMGTVVKTRSDNNVGGNLANIPDPTCTSPLNAIGSTFYDFWKSDNNGGAKWSICMRPGYSGEIKTCEVKSQTYPVTPCEPEACSAGMTPFTGLIQTSQVLLQEGTYYYVFKFSRLCMNHAEGGSITAQTCPSDTIDLGEITDSISNIFVDYEANTNYVGDAITSTVTSKICMNKAAPAPTQSQFTINKTAMYDYANKRINYTITVRNNGPAISGEAVLVRDVLPNQLVPSTPNTLDSFSPQPTMIMGMGEIVWELENFGNTTDTSYNYTSFLLTDPQLRRYSSNGVFIINIVLNIDPNTQNGTIITNHANVTARGATASGSVDTAYLATIRINETIPVYRCWWTQHWDYNPQQVTVYGKSHGPTVMNHYVSFDASCDNNHFDTLVGHLYKNQKENTIPLYQCYRTKHEEGHDYVDHFVSTDVGCEGYVFNGLLGYAPASATAETEAWYRCWTVDDFQNGVFDHMISKDYACESTPYRNERIIFNFLKEPVVTEILPTAPICGDGSINQPWEECDNGPFNSNTAADACRLNCSLPRCGDGVVDFARGEECDPPNGQTCDISCHTIQVTPVPTNVTNYTYIPPATNTPPTIPGPSTITTNYIALGTCTDNPIIYDATYGLGMSVCSNLMPGEAIIQLKQVGTLTGLIIAGGSPADVSAAVQVLKNLTKWSAEGARLDITSNAYLTTVGRLSLAFGGWRYNMEYTLPAGIHFIGVPFSLASKTITNNPALSTAGGIFAYDATNNRSVKFDVDWPASPPLLSDLTTFGNELEAYYVKMNTAGSFMLRDATKATTAPIRNIPAAGWAAYTPYGKQKTLSSIVPVGTTVNSLWCYENNGFTQKSLSSPVPTIDVGQGCWINLASGATLS